MDIKIVSLPVCSARVKDYAPLEIDEPFRTIKLLLISRVMREADIIDMGIKFSCNYAGWARKLKLQVAEDLRLTRLKKTTEMNRQCFNFFSFFYCAMK